MALTTMDQDHHRERTIRTRNRALVVVLIALAALFYAITIVRMGG
jgi:hypothetical protein